MCGSSASSGPAPGQSTRHLYPDVRAFADDLEVVADTLELDRFGVIGLSGGGPYALACAHAMPDRVVAAVVLGGVAPTVGDDTPWRRCRRPDPHLPAPHHPRPFGLGVALDDPARAIRPFGHQGLALYAAIGPEGDKIAFAAPGMEEMFLDDINDAAAKNGLGRRRPTSSCSGAPGGSRWPTIRSRSASGTATRTTSSRWPTPSTCATLVPDAELQVRPGESHLGTLVVGDEALLYGGRPVELSPS